MRHVDACFFCSKLVADDISCFEPEAGAYLVKGLNFHKFYFNNGLFVCYYLAVEMLTLLVL